MAAKGGAWQLVKGKGNRKGQRARAPGPMTHATAMQQALAKEIVSNLFHSPNRYSVLSSDEEAGLPEWKCKDCGIFNFATRKVCRRCGEKAGTKGGSRGSGPVTSPSRSLGTPPAAKPDGATKGATQGKGSGKGKSVWGKGASLQDTNDSRRTREKLVWTKKRWR